jgi:hypothetical protein
MNTYTLRLAGLSLMVLGALLLTFFKIDVPNFIFNQSVTNYTLDTDAPNPSWLTPTT